MTAGIWVKFHSFIGAIEVVSNYTVAITLVSIAKEVTQTDMGKLNCTKNGTKHNAIQQRKNNMHGFGL